jgi:hypothetical protein
LVAYGDRPGKMDIVAYPGAGGQCRGKDGNEIDVAWILGCYFGLVFLEDAERLRDRVGRTTPGWARRGSFAASELGLLSPMLPDVCP